MKVRFCSKKNATKLAKVKRDNGYIRTQPKSMTEKAAWESPTTAAMVRSDFNN